MASVSYHIANLLEKMTSSDKDFRFMATNDLMAELQKDSIKLDDDSERKVVKMLLKLLEDKNGEVQNLAVKCLGPLVNKVKEFQVETIVDTLCTNMLSDKEQIRDISSIGLKTVIIELPPASTALASSICKKITGRLTAAINKQEDVPVQLEALDILGDLLSRFGGLLISFHPTIQKALLQQLDSPRLAVRKRAIIALSHLVMSCNASLFNELMDFLVVELSGNTNSSTYRTYIQCVGAITRAAGHRVGEHLERIIPLIVKFCRVDDDELKEYCLQAFESFVRKCPKQISPHIQQIVEICLSYLCYDPNYNYDDGDEDMDIGEDDENGETDDEYSDDDDMSWKVRRASAKCLDAVMASRHELLYYFYTTISPVLITRFKEREENVKTDIFYAYITLLKQTKPSVSSDPDAMEQDESPVSILQGHVPDIVGAIRNQLKERSLKTRQGCFRLLTELVNVLPGALKDHIPYVLPGIQVSLKEKNTSSNMKIDTLAFINCILSSHPPEVFHPYVSDLIDPIVTAVNDPFYKITSEALLVTQQLVKVILGADKKTENAKMLFNCTFFRLQTADIDQEVKERAISCMGQIVCDLGDVLEEDSLLNRCLPLFLDRLKNEITRLVTVKALTLIAGSKHYIDLSCILAQAMPILASFLRKNHRALRLSTLLCLEVLVKKYGKAMNSSMFSDVIKELPALITENDLHVSQLSLILLTRMCTSNTMPVAMIEADILPPLLTLVQSPLLQGAALAAMLEFFQTLVKAQIPRLGFKDLLKQLMAPVYDNASSSSSLVIHKQAFQSIAKCVAALTITSSNEERDLVNKLIADVLGDSSDSIRLLALLTLGDIGKYFDLSSHTNIQDVILSAFSSQNEEIKSAASYALGNIAIGNLSRYLPFVLKEIDTPSKKQYLLLHSLKEIISGQSVDSKSAQLLQPYVEKIWNVLMQHCESPEEGTRNVVAECLGKLTLIDPNTRLPCLKQNLTTSSAMTRSTIITAVKFTISDQPQPIDTLLRNSMADFLEALDDNDLNVRRVALVAFNSAAHNKPSLIRDLLNKVLPHLYSETIVRKEYIREVEMGPFKHTVDDGLDIRKAAFECMYTLLDTCLDRIDIFEFLKHVEQGLTDHYDIKMLAYLMLVRLAQLTPTAVLQHLDRIVDPLRATCTTKVKANSVKQEFEKQDELKRSALRAVQELLSIPDADKNPLMNEFMSQIRANPELALMLDTIQKDSGSSSDTSLMEVN